MLYKLQLKEKKPHIFLVFPVIISEDNLSALVDEGKLLYRRISFGRLTWKDGRKDTLLPSLKYFVGQLSPQGEIPGEKVDGELDNVGVSLSQPELTTLTAPKLRPPDIVGPPTVRQHKAFCNVYSVFLPRSLT